MSFCVWLTSLSKMSSRFIHVVANYSAFNGWFFIKFNLIDPMWLNLRPARLTAKHCSSNSSKSICSGFPGGAVVENLPANAGDTGSNPGLGRSHMSQSNWAHVPQLLSLCVWSLCSATREAATVRGPCTTMKSGPRLPQLEKALAQKRRPNTAKNKLIN